MKSYHYVYETTNLTNGKKYVGQHSTYDLEDGYFGSNQQLKRDIRKGHLYKIEIIKHCNDKHELAKAEYDEIERKNAVADPTYYNLSNINFVNKFGERHKEETKQKIGEKNKISLKGKKHSLLRCMRKSERSKGIPKSDETRKKLSESLKGRLKGRVLSEEHKKKISESRKKYFQNQ